MQIKREPSVQATQDAWLPLGHSLGSKSYVSRLERIVESFASTRDEAWPTGWDWMCKILDVSLKCTKYHLKIISFLESSAHQNHLLAFPSFASSFVHCCLRFYCGNVFCLILGSQPRCHWVLPLASISTRAENAVLSRVEVQGTLVPFSFPEFFVY